MKMLTHTDSLNFKDQIPEMQIEDPMLEAQYIEAFLIYGNEETDEFSCNTTVWD